MAELGPSIFDPDNAARGFLGQNLEALRYDGKTLTGGEAHTLIVRQVPKDARVLDVGCGEGSIATLLRKCCSATVVGIEPQRARADAAREKGFEVITGILSPDLASQLGSFDCVIFADVLEHMPDPCSTLELARQFLTPGGFVAASVPNVAHWTVRLDLLKGRFDYRPVGIMDATHLRWFTIDSVRLLFERAGFNVTALEGAVGLWMPEYKKKPWRWLPKKLKRQLVVFAVSRWPALFASQFVVKAVP